MSTFTLPVNGYVTQSYGKQKDGSFHPGIDFHAPIGTPVKAIGDGVISSQGLNGDCGNTVILQHSNGFESVYCHLSNFLLQPGATVKQGDIIAFSGGKAGEVGAGNSKVPHLHLQIDKGKGAANHVDPTTLLGLGVTVTPTPSSPPYENKDSIITQLKKMVLGGPALAVLTANGGNNPITNAIPGSGVAKDVVGGFTSTSKLIGFISNPANLKRVGVGAIGVTLVIVGSVELLKETPIGGTIKKVAAKTALG